jgi:hypothetical protein
MEDRRHPRHPSRRAQGRRAAGERLSMAGPHARYRRIVVEDEGQEGGTDA